MSWLDSLKSLWDPTVEIRQWLTEQSEAPKSPAVLLKSLQFQIDRRLGLNAPSALQGLFKGHGLEYLSLREYQPGDDVRKIDWNVLARTGSLHVRQHYEERQIPVWFFIDITEPMHFGQTRPKLAAVQSLVGMLGLMALNAGHRLGFILWDGSDNPLILPLKQSSTHLEHALHRLDQILAQGPRVQEKQAIALPNLPRLFQTRSLVFLLSDFAFLSEGSPLGLGALGQLRGHHQVSSMLLVDPMEAHLALGRGWLPLGAGTPAVTAWINTNDRWAVRAYIKAFRKTLAEKETLLRTLGRVQRVYTDMPLLESIIRWSRAA